MNIVFRVDASSDIGYGHIMRCMTLADKLAEQGASIRFICRDLPAHSGDYITNKGYTLSLLTYRQPNSNSSNKLLLDWSNDIAETNGMLNNPVDLLIIDHYEIDAKWHRKKSSLVNKVMVIDDMANRELDCDILLDQTYKREKVSYEQWLASEAHLLIGTKYALLRPQFSENREKALNKRKLYSGIQRILISFGGADNKNHSAEVLDLLDKIELSHEPIIDVVLGQGAKHVKELKALAKQYKASINILHNVDNMAEIMLAADISFGAAGSTSWERCVMALPTIMFVDAENQSLIAGNLQQAGAASVFQSYETDSPGLTTEILDLDSKSKQYERMSKAAATICDGYGADRVVEQIYATV